MQEARQRVLFRDTFHVPARARVEDVPPQPLEGMSADGVGLFGEPARLGGARVEGGRAGAVRVAGHREERARREREPERRRRRLLSEEGTPG